MMDAVTRENCSLSVVHPDRDRDDEGPARVFESLVDILVELKAPGGLVELGKGGPEHRGIEIGFLSHLGPFVGQTASPV
jgi:hypothetical protein